MRRFPQAFFAARQFSHQLRGDLAIGTSAEKKHKNACLIRENLYQRKSWLVSWLVGWLVGHDPYYVYLLIFKTTTYKKYHLAARKTKYLNKTTRNNYSYRLKLKPLKICRQTPDGTLLFLLLQLRNFMSSPLWKHHCCHWLGNWESVNISGDVV